MLLKTDSHIGVGEVLGSSAAADSGQTCFMTCFINHNTPTPVFFISVDSKES